MRVAPARLVLSLLAAGCGAGSKRATAPTVAPTTTAATASEATTTSAATTTAAPAPKPPPAAAPTVRLYLLRDGKLTVVSRPAAQGGAVARGALDDLFAGLAPNEANTGLTTAVSPGNSIQRLAIRDGVAELDTARRLRPGAELAQVVYTLTQFAGVKRVSIVLETNDSADFGRGDFESVTPPILVEAPTPGDQVRSPVRVRGSSNTFEATLYIDVIQGSRTIVKQKLVTATSGSGTRGTFDASIAFHVDRAGLGQIVAYEIDAGSGKRTHAVSVPVVLAP
jgi:hypothetical protein